MPCTAWSARSRSAWPAGHRCLSWSYPSYPSAARSGDRRGRLGAADQAAGQRIGRLAVGVGLLAADERVQVPFGALQEPTASAGKIEVHLDSATGPMLGESELISPTTDPAAPPSQLRTALKPTSGLHDLYLVFRNPDAKGDQFLFGVLTATFEAAPR